MPRKRVLIFIVAYNAGHRIADTIRRIPESLREFDTEILVIDDSSKDDTFEFAQACTNANLPFQMTVLYNPVNQGYGGNQKLGFEYAIQHGFDIVALVHGDGQYAPECLPDLLHPLLNDQVEAVFGSRMMTHLGALKGGMPFYKYLGNIILTSVQNRLLGSSLSEFHSGYRLYSVKALRLIPFDRNTNDFHFDTDIIIQLLRADLRIKELPIPTYYGDEICHVNGLKYAKDVVKTTLLAKLQDLGIFYQRKFDVSSQNHGNPLYLPKFGFDSPHTLALERVKPGSPVLDIGCASGYVARALSGKGCRVTGVDHFPVSSKVPLDHFIQHDLDRPCTFDITPFNHVLLLDVVEHLRDPEEFMASLRASTSRGKDTTIIMSTGNVAFIITRLMLFLGSFNYGARGILDLTHTRLFTFSSLRNLLLQTGYQIEEVRGVPAPFPLAIGDNIFANLLLGLNKFLIRISKTLFSYQIFMVARPLPTVDSLLRTSVEASIERISMGRASTLAGKAKAAVN